MKLSSRLLSGSLLLLWQLGPGHAENAAPTVPRFSVEHMDRAIDPSTDFYHFAAGEWLKQNPVPADKSRWGGFDQLQERNWFLIREILEENAPATSTRSKEGRQVGDFYSAAMNTHRLEQLGFKPIRRDLARIAAVKNADQFFAVLADLHLRDVGGLFAAGVSPDAKNSSRYAFQVRQAGLRMPDRDYYLTETFATQREAYRRHIIAMLKLIGESESEAVSHAATVLGLETELAKASKTRVELRDPIANYNKFTVRELEERSPSVHWRTYLRELGVPSLVELVVGQTNFLTAVDTLVKSRPLADWQTYLRWHVIASAAPFLNGAMERESFAFNGTILRGQLEPEPRWQRAAKVIDAGIGESLGKLFVERHYPPAARARMTGLIDNLREVFRDRLRKLDWMSDATRARALAKFNRFTQKIGHPDKFRDYSRIRLRRDDYLGNIQRAASFESRRQLARVGQPVDRSEWRMTPQTVNAYFNPLQNEIVFPAGILQPPFFDVTADDAVNYGAIGVVIGHEITHGFDDRGRQYDADGNLNDWWTEADAKEFETRARKLVDQYAGYEVLPGLKVNGRLTLGENIADLGGASIAYEALQRALTKDPARRRTIDGFTPEQRFFLSLAQLWRTNWRDAELRRRITVDPHSPGQFRAIGPHVNLPEFYDAFGIREGAAMWRAPELRAKIW